MPNKEKNIKPRFLKSQITGFFNPGIWDFTLFPVCSPFLFLFLIVSFHGCKDPEIGTLEVLPGSETLGLLTNDTSTIISFTQQDDSIRSDETSLNLLGIYNDPVFGTAIAGIYTQVRLSVENYNFGDPSNVFVDSVVLSLAYSGIYGNTVPQGFRVFELSESMNKDSMYYSTKTFLMEPSPAGSVSGLVPDLTDSVNVGGQNEPPQMRIALKNSFGQKLISESGYFFGSNTDFLSKFSGLAILPDTSTAPAAGDGAILYFDLKSPFSRLTVYYSGQKYHSVRPDSTEPVSKKYEFLINDNCARVNNFAFSRPGISIFASDSLAGNNNIYIQSMAGARAKIKVPFIESFIGKGRIVVNKAEIILKVEDNTTGLFSPHSGLFLTNIDSSGKAGFLLDQFEGDDHYGGTFNSSAGEYVFNITRHMQYLLNNYYEGKDYNNGMFLMGGGKAVNASRTILKGNLSSSGGIKLKISYTPL